MFRRSNSSSRLWKVIVALHRLSGQKKQFPIKTPCCGNDGTSPNVHPGWVLRRQPSGVRVINVFLFISDYSFGSSQPHSHGRDVHLRTCGPAGDQMKSRGGYPWTAQDSRSDPYHIGPLKVCKSNEFFSIMSMRMWNIS